MLKCVQAFWLLLSLLGGLGFAGGCAKRDTVPPGEVFDAGTVYSSRTTELKHVFRATNSTPRTVRILEEIHSCACTKVSVDRVTLRPGEDVPLSLSVNVPLEYTEFSGSCTLKTDDPQFPNWTYQLRFRAYPRTRFSPDRIDLGTLSENEAELKGVLKGTETRTDAWLEVFGPRDEPGAVDFKVLKVPDELHVRIGRPPQVDVLPSNVKRVRYPVTVDLRGPLSLGYHASPLSVRVSGGDLPATAMVMWHVTGLVVVSPSPVSFGTVGESDAPGRAVILVESSDRRDFKITSVESESRFVTGREQERESLGTARGIRKVDLFIHPQKQVLRQNLWVHESKRRRP
jgi:hypothetical protein